MRSGLSDVCESARFSDPANRSAHQQAVPSARLPVPSQLPSAAFSTSAQSQVSVQEETIEESTSEDSGSPLSDIPRPTGH